LIGFDSIIWPTDFSEHSDDALKTALDFAKHFDAELHAVHVIESLPVMGATGAQLAFNVADYREHLEKEAESRLKSELEEKVPNSIKSHHHVLHGMPADRITEFACKMDKALIVISTHGQTGFRHFIHGSVAERVVRFATCPVLSMRADDKEDD